MYYLRTKAAAQAVQFTVEKRTGIAAPAPANSRDNLENDLTAAQDSDETITGATCSMQDGCLSCGS
jgi:ribonucleoside-diphosphate reductase alpha chain